MALIADVKSLADLPGYARLAEVARRHEEPMALRGSALRRLVVRLLRGESIDYLLPALCSPPPSDLDLLFDTDDADMIGTLLCEMRDTSPILQSVRLEVSSVLRVEKLHDELAAHIDCSVFGLALPALVEEGFTDPSDRALQEIADGSLTFRLSDQARKRWRVRSRTTSARSSSSRSPVGTRTTTYGSPRFASGTKAPKRPT